MSVSAVAAPTLTKLGRYELITPIGRGGMAEVHLAIDRETKQLVVIKLLHEELASQKQFVDMLLGEAKLAALIKHPSVVDIYELGEDNGRHFIAMEYLEGESLLAVLEAGYAGRRLDPLSMARLIVEVAEGLHAAHELALDGKPLRIVHHDISLGNIFVLYGGQAKLLDFGVSKATHSAAKLETAQTEKVFGKLAYMAPEKLDERPGDRRSDIWSLGCVLWEALTHKRLFKGANDIELMREVRYVNVPAPSSVNPDVPAELDPVVLRALQRDPRFRYQTAKELGAALEEVLTAKAYGGKNYRITAYMVSTFGDRIAARERLVREVTGEHQRPSAEIIDAAFGDTQARKESSLPSLDDILSQSRPVTLPEDATGAEAMMPTMGAGPNPFDEDEVAETVFDDVPPNPEASRTMRSEPNPSWNRGKHGESLRELQQKLQERRENPQRNRLLVPLGAGAALLIVLLIALAVKCSGGDGEPAATAAPSSSAPPVPRPETAPAEPAAPAAAAVAPPDEELPIADEIEMQPEPAPDPDTKKRKRTRPKQSAEALYNEGLEQLRKNDHKAALASFTRARRANTNFAPAWYGLGLVHERLGRNGAAKAAYQRYLSLAPKAANAQQIRDRIGRL